MGAAHQEVQAGGCSEESNPDIKVGLDTESYEEWLKELVVFSHPRRETINGRREAVVQDGVKLQLFSIRRNLSSCSAL